MAFENPKREKKRGREALLKELDGRMDDLSHRRKSGWIKEDEYEIERKKLEDERLEVLTDPGIG